MSMKRLATIGIIAAALTLTACTGGATGPTASPTTTPTPTPTAAGPVEPPTSEEEAITAATGVLEQSLILRGEVSAAGGEGIEEFDAILTGPALTAAQQEIALYEDQGYTTTGAVTADLGEGYTAEWEGVEFGYVTLPSCTDFSTLVITKADGSPAPRPEVLQYPVDYQVVYLAEEKAWKVYDMIKTGDTC